jgi:hypothetical protein
LFLEAAELANAGPDYLDASNHVNRAVTELHRVASWTTEEMERIAGVQRELVEMLLAF